MIYSNYSSAISYLYSCLPNYEQKGGNRIKFGLKNIELLCERLNWPQNSFKSVHIGGTNGKGTVSNLWANYLINCGFKVGLYTSPHIVDFRERIRVDGQKINQAFVTDWVNLHHQLIDEIGATFFEATVAMAFDYFRGCKVDYAVIEVGMGGRLDSTNIVNPELSIITNIGLDHTKFLGNTLEQIAIEKAGIIKLGKPVVIGEKHPETQNVFIEVAKQKSAALTFATDMFNVKLISNQIHGTPIVELTSLQYHANIAYNLYPKYQLKNLNTFAASVFNTDHKLPINNNAFIKTCAEIGPENGLLGRWQYLSVQPYIIADVGHNPHAIAQLNADLNHISTSLHIIFGAASDKDVLAMLAEYPSESTFYLVQPKTPRALPIADLIKICEKLNLKFFHFGSIEVTYNVVKQKLQPHETLLISGSNFVIAELFESQGLYID